MLANALKIRQSIETFSITKRKIAPTCCAVSLVSPRSEKRAPLSSFNCLRSSVESHGLTNPMQVIQNLIYLADIAPDPADALKYAGMAKAHLHKLDRQALPLT